MQLPCSLVASFPSLGSLWFFIHDVFRPTTPLTVQKAERKNNNLSLHCMMWPVCWVQESNSTQAEIHKYINNWLNLTNNFIFLRQCSLARPIKRYEQNNSVFKIPDKNVQTGLFVSYCALYTHIHLHTCVAM